MEGHSISTNKSMFKVQLKDSGAETVSTLTPALFFQKKDPKNGKP